MAKYLFLGSKFQSFKDDGSVNASGTVEFFALGGAFSTYVSSYTDSTLATANPNTITLDAAGRADIWLNTNADVRIKDSSGTTLDTATSINPSATNTVEGDNLVANPSFETDSDGDNVPDDWALTAYTGGTSAIDTTDSSHGKQSLKFVSTGNGGGTATTDNFFSVSPSTTLFVNFDLKSTADVRNLMQVLWYDRSQVALGSPSSDLYDDSTTNPTSWTRQFTSVAVPSTAYFAKLKFFGAHSSDATSGTVRIDNIRATAPEGGVDVQVFTGNGTWTKPAGLRATSRVLLQAWAGGGSGGTNTSANAGGGGGGAYTERWLALSALGATESITVGAGGAARTGGSDLDGLVGGNTTIGSLLAAYGGGGGGGDTGDLSGGGGGGALAVGAVGAATAGAGGGPAGGAGGGGAAGADSTMGGGGGGDSTFNGGNSGWGGGGGGGNGANGGSSLMGGGGGAGAAGTAGTSVGGGAGGAPGTAGTQPGGGGGGSNNATSGAGGAGQVIVTVFPA